MGKSAHNGSEGAYFGTKVRALRRRENLSQVELARRLDVSASYLNLIEANRRPLPAALLVKLAQLCNLDLRDFTRDEDARLISDLYEMFADPLFESAEIKSPDLRELASSQPGTARAVVSLYGAYQQARQLSEQLATTISEDAQGADAESLERLQLPSEQVSDYLQRHLNYFPDLEAGAEELWQWAGLEFDELYSRLLHYLEQEHGVTVRVLRWGQEPGTLRRYDPERRRLTLSELLPTRSRTFQVAHQVALLVMEPVLERLSSDPKLNSEAARTLLRVALANYFAGAVLMPYQPFLQAAQQERYDIEVIGRRFRVSFEQVCHRLSSLRRPGAEGVPFHMIRTDIAGNISKRFSASGIRFARFSGACPKWNVFTAFMTPGMVRIQVARMPDGVAYFSVARTIHKDSGGYHSQQPVQAISLGCQVEHARELVYSDGVDLDNLDAATKVGVTCRLCEHPDCEQRAFPSLREPLQIDANVRTVSLYTPRRT
jgi:predicted transcriptional regulator/transcriptional regulator with XRE-family HTH domain